jgi:hypothetical protein
VRLSRGKEYRFNMGNYEHLQVSAMVTVDALDLYPDGGADEIAPDQLLKELNDFCEQSLAKILDPEVEEAARMSQAEKSILPEPPPAPRRERTKTTTRSTR